MTGSTSAATPADPVEPHDDGRGPPAVLVGPPGSGKTTVARALGERWQLAVRDTDADVEETAGKAVSEIFFDDGEPRFRALEADAVERALSEHDGVLALGGGAVLDSRTQANLERYVARGGVVVFLDVSLAQAAPRVGFNVSRPLLLGNPRAQWQALMDARRPTYEAVSTMRVLTDGHRPVDVAQLIEVELAASRLSAPGRRTQGEHQ